MIIDITTKKYKILSILALTLSFISSYTLSILIRYTTIFNNTPINIFDSISSVILVISVVLGIISTIGFIRNIKDIKLYWLIPAILSIVLNLGALIVN